MPGASAPAPRLGSRGLDGASGGRHRGSPFQREGRHATNVDRAPDRHAGPHGGSSRARPGRPASVVEPLGRRGFQEGRALRGQAALRGEAPRAHGRNHLLREEEHVARPPGGVHGGLRLPGRLLLRQRRPRVHGRRVARRSLAGDPLGEHRALREGLLDPPRPRGQGRDVGHPRRGRVRRDLLQQEALPRPGHRGTGQLHVHPGAVQGRRRQVREGRPCGLRHRRRGPGMGGDVPPGHAAPLEARLRRRAEALPGGAQLEGPARRGGLPLLQGARRPRRVCEDPHQHAARRGPPLLPHGAEGVHVPGRDPGTRAAPSSRRRRAGSPRASSSGSSTTPS